jgi:hypothetical protein
MLRRSTCLALLGLIACSGAAGSRLPSAAPLPEARAARVVVLQSFGTQLFAALARGAPLQILFDDEALRALLEPGAAARAASLRHNLSATLSAELGDGGLFHGAKYQALCIQRARPEPAGGMLGLRQAGWVFDRVLVVAEEPGGGRVAAWAEGVFLHTDQGLGAVDLSRLEAPRRDHADLELARCDLVAGAWTPQPVVGGGLLDH